MSPLPLLLCAYLAIGIAHVVTGATQVFRRRRAPDPHAPARWGFAWPVGDARWLWDRCRRARTCTWRPDAAMASSPQIFFARMGDLEPISGTVDE